MPYPPLPPGPRGLPLVGHYPWLLHDPLSFFTRLARDYGDVAAFHVPRRRYVLVSHPLLIDRVLRDRGLYRSEPTRKAMASFLGTGLFSLEGAQHLVHRRLMQPAFHKQRIARYGAIMERAIACTLATFEGGQTRDLSADMMRLTLAIVAEALFDADTRDRTREIVEALSRLSPLARAARLMRGRPTEASLPYPRWTGGAVTRLRALVRSVVAERVRAGGHGEDLLSMLLAARDEEGAALTEEDVCAEVLSILLAGHETTALTLSWALHLLTLHPEVQEAVACQVIDVVGARRVTVDDLPSLPLVRQLACETMRLYPAAWAADRAAQADLELGGFRIRAGTVMVMSAYVMHRDPRFFSEPERFDLGRFSPARQSRVASGAFLPFGAGAHVCIGSGFAMVEVQLVLASMAQRFRFLPRSVRSIRPRAQITLGMAEALIARLEARTLGLRREHPAEEPAR